MEHKSFAESWSKLNKEHKKFLREYINKERLEEMGARTDYSVDETLVIAKNMLNFGGSFVQHLGKALLHADFDNKRRLFVQFPEYMTKYFNFNK